MSRTGTGTRLIDVHPWARDQWAGDPELLETVNISSPAKILWRCADGHEFIESVHVRVGRQKWKRGQIDACPYCMRHLYIVTFRCGHTREYRATSATETPERHQAAAQVECNICRPPHEVWGTPKYRAEKTRIFEEKGALYPEARIKLGHLMDKHDVPPPLRHALGGPDVLRRIVESLHAGQPDDGEWFGRHVNATLPSIEACDGTNVVRIGQQTFWTAGWRHHLGQPTTPPALELGVFTPKDFHAFLASCEDLTTTRTTKEMTRALAAVMRERGWQPYKELAVPVVAPGRTSYGRLDLVAFRPNKPDLVVEIDSDTGANSIPKLEYARDAGAVVYWLRWGKGAIREIPGVHVIDVRRSQMPTQGATS